MCCVALRCGAMRHRNVSGVNEPLTSQSGWATNGVSSTEKSVGLFWGQRKCGKQKLHVHVRSRITVLTRLVYAWNNYPRNICHVIDIVYEKWGVTWGQAQILGVYGPHTPRRNATAGNCHRPTAYDTSRTPSQPSRRRLITGPPTHSYSRCRLSSCVTLAYAT